MPAVTSLSDIAGTIAQIRWLDGTTASEQPDPFYVLLLADGFSDSEESKFTGFLNGLVEQFFEISPFDYCRPYISFLYCFLPASHSGLDGAPDDSDGKWRRPLRTIVQGDRFRYEDNEHIFRVVYRLKLPGDLKLDASSPRSSAAVWLSRRSKSYGAIAVVTNTDRSTAQNPKGGTSFSELLPTEIAALPAGDVGRWFTMGMDDYSSPPTTPSGRYVNVFAHELAHSLGLDDEYEPYETLSAANLPADSFLADASNVQWFEAVDPAWLPERLKWRDLLSLDQREGIRRGDLVFTKPYLASKGLIPDADSRDRTIHVLDPRRNQPLHWSQIFVVEGARYRRQVYRPHLECKMRFDTYDERVTSEPGRYVQVTGGVVSTRTPSSVECATSVSVSTSLDGRSLVSLAIRAQRSRKCFMTRSCLAWTPRWDGRNRRHQWRKRDATSRALAHLSYLGSFSSLRSS